MPILFHILAFAVSILRESLERPETQKEIQRVTKQVLHEGLTMLHKHILSRAEKYSVS